MKILIACEFSGIVRDAFAARGHVAISCDLLPTERPEGTHWQGDVLEFIKMQSFDLMIAHPPCTYLSTVGNRHLKQPGRAERRAEAVAFFMALWNTPIKKKCLENPVGYMSSIFRKPDQIIQPYEYGHPVQKRTALWLDNLPPLRPTNILPKPEPAYFCRGRKAFGKAIHYVEAAPGDGEERRKYRSRTFTGIAEAMAEQWG